MSGVSPVKLKVPLLEPNKTKVVEPEPAVKLMIGDPPFEPAVNVRVAVVALVAVKTPIVGVEGTVAGTVVVMDELETLEESPLMFVANTENV